MSDEEQAARSSRRRHDELGGLHILVNNAGVMLLGPVAGADTDEWRRMIEVNLLGLLYCTHAALPLMAAGGGGDIVNVSSVAGRSADAGAAVYNMTKFGVHALLRGAAPGGASRRHPRDQRRAGFRRDRAPGPQHEPAGARATERMREQIGEVLKAEDIADEIVYTVTRPSHVCVNEVWCGRPGRPAERHSVITYRRM